MRLVINGRFLSQRATGVQRVAHEFTRALDRLMDDARYPGLSVRLVAQADADPAPLALRNIAFEPARGARGHAWEQFVLPRHVGDATLLCLGNSAPLASLLGRRPVGVMLHDQAYLLFPEDYGRGYRLWHRVLDRAILHCARPLFTVSETERAVIAARHPRARAEMIVAANGSWIDDAPPAGDAGRGAAGTGAYGIYVGSFTARKNIDAIFGVALALAQQRGIGFRFVGPPNAASEAFKAGLPADVRDLIRFPGFVSNAELSTLYAGAAFLLYPSLYEASGLPPAEAMTFGCPVIVSDLPVLRERCGDAALYCDPYDRAGLLAAALRIVDEPGLARRLSARGRGRAEALTWRNQALRIMTALATA